MPHGFFFPKYKSEQFLNLKSIARQRDPAPLPWLEPSQSWDGTDVHLEVSMETPAGDVLGHPLSPQISEGTNGKSETPTTS